MIVVKSPAKLILFGEHAVVYGKLGIATSLDLYTTVTIENSDKLEVINPTRGNFILEKSGIRRTYRIFSRACKEGDYESLKDFTFKDMYKVVAAMIFEHTKYRPCRVTFDFAAPIKGIGGSSSAFAGFAVGMAKFFDIELKRYQINQITYTGDIIANASLPSGIDNNTVVYGGYIAYTKDGGMERLKIDNKLSVVMVDSGEYVKTSTMVKMIKDASVNNPEFENIMNKLNDITESALEKIKTNNVTELGTMMYEYYDELKKLDISTNKLDKIIRIAKKNGFVGAKPTGAWGGGTCVILARNKDEITQIKRIYEKNGFKTYEASTGVPGVKLISN